MIPVGILLSLLQGGVAPTHDALHYDVDLTLAGEGNRLAATVITTWLVSHQGPIRIDLDSTLALLDTKLDGQPVTAQRSGDQLLIPHRGAKGDTVITTVSYAGVPSDGLVQRGSGSGRTIFADNWPNRGHRWLAAFDHPSDKATVAWTVVAPSELTVVATGVQEGVERLSSGLSRWTIRMRDPTPVHTMVVGAAAMAVTPLPPAQCRIRCVPVSVVTYPRDSAFAVNGPFRRATEMIDFFVSRFGPFPYEELKHIQSSTIFGGMENSTAIFYDEKRYTDRTMAEGVVAHETAHQWFGDAVSQRSWSHLWLSEGFATYGAALWAEFDGGSTGLRKAMDAARTRVMQSTATERPILDSTANLMALLNSNNYQKGSWVLHSLRGLLGDTVFFRGLRTYYERFRHGNVDSQDFARVMSSVLGEPLDWFFRQSLEQPGYPILEIDRAIGAGGTVLTIRQVQGEAWGTYRLPNLVVRVGAERHTVDVRERLTRITLPSTTPPDPAIEVDPDGWWLLEVRASGSGS